jgi:hypothetical protein
MWLSMSVRSLLRAYSTIDCIVLRHFDLPLTIFLFLTSISHFYSTLLESSAYRHSHTHTISRAPATDTQVPKWSSFKLQNADYNLNTSAARFSVLFERSVGLTNNNAYILDSSVPSTPISAEMLYPLSYCAGTSATPAQRYETLRRRLRRARMASAFSSAASTGATELLSPPTAPLHFEPTTHGNSNVGTLVAGEAFDNSTVALSTTSLSLSSATTETIEGVRDVQNAVDTPPSLPSPPRARLAKKKPRTILSSLDTALTNKYYTRTVSPSDPIEEIPGCGHPLHPAYADTYDEFQCPMCLYLDSKSRQSKLDKFIESENGVQSWRDWNLDPSVPKSTKDYLRFKRTVRGGFLKHLEDEAVDKHGLDISHRHNKKRLANLEMELEVWAREEKEWQDTHLEEYAAIHEVEKAELRKSSATFALAYHR